MLFKYWHTETESSCYLSGPQVCQQMSFLIFILESNVTVGQMSQCMYVLYLCSLTEFFEFLDEFLSEFDLLLNNGLTCLGHSKTRQG